MARAAQTKNYYSFVKGLITEASPLTFPEETSKDEQNCVLNLDGSRQRRRGLKKSAEGTFVNTDNDGAVFGAFEWRAANNSSENSFVVVQWGRYILFFRQDTDDLADGFVGSTVISGPSTSGVTNAGDVIDLVDIKQGGVANSEVSSSLVDMSFGNGKLFIVGQHIQPIFVTYIDSTDEVYYEEIPIRTRDTEGAEYTSGTDYNVQIDSNPSSLTSEHLYNLLNQGWPESRISGFRSSQGYYPSNSQIFHFGYYVGTGGTRTFDPSEIENTYFGNTLAPRGHFLRNIFNTTQSFSLQGTIIPVSVDAYDDINAELTLSFDADHDIGAGSGESVTFRNTVIAYTDSMGSTTQDLDGLTFTEGTDLVVNDNDTFTIDITLLDYVSGGSLDTAGFVEIESITNPSGQSTDNRPESVAFYAGRVWYAGVQASYLAGKIFFSQIIENERQYGQCYQSADPTAEEVNSLVDTDGGVLSIPEIGQVLRMVVVGSSLIIFADNGVWEVSGGADGSFTATSFSIRQVMRESISSKFSIVSAEGTPFFFTDTGIYTLSQDNISGYLTPQNLSVQTIQSEFNDIPNGSFSNIKTFYNPLDKVVGWCYNDGSSSSEKLNTILQLDLRLSAFFKYTVDDSNEYIVAPAIVINTSDENKKVQFFSVTNVTNGDFVWADFTDTSFLDWGDTNYVSYLETGHDTLGDTIRDKQATFVECYFERTEDGYELDANGNIALSNPSSCNLTAKWEWSDSANSGREHGPYQVYRLRRNYIPENVNDPFDYGFEVVYTRSKIRGKGKSLRLRFESEQGKDFKLLGWSIPYTANGSG